MVANLVHRSSEWRSYLSLWIRCYKPEPIGTNGTHLSSEVLLGGSGREKLFRMLESLSTVEPELEPEVSGLELGPVSDQSERNLILFSLCDTS